MYSAELEARYLGLVAGLAELLPPDLAAELRANGFRVLWEYCAASRIGREAGADAAVRHHLDMVLSAMESPVAVLSNLVVWDRMPSGTSAWLAVSRSLSRDYVEGMDLEEWRLRDV